LQLFHTLVKNKNWKLTYLEATRPDYHVQMLKALAAGHHLQIATRELSEKPRSYVNVRHRAPAKLTAVTNLGAVSRGNEWVIYNDFYSDGVDETKNTIRLVSAIVPELFVSARPEYWWDVEFLPKGHIKDRLVDIIAGMTGNTKNFIRGGMPKNPAGGQS
jgi:hypothetical protein